MKKRIGVIVASVAALGALLWLYSVIAGQGQQPVVNVDSYAALGAGTAGETAKLLGNKGEVVVIARDTGEQKNVSIEAELKAFDQTFKSIPGVRVAKERVKMTPMMMMTTGGGLPGEDFVRVIK